MVKKIVSEEEFLETLTLPGYTNTKSDYEVYQDQQLYYSLVKKLKSAIKRGKTSSPQYFNAVSDYKSLCEKLGVPLQLNV